MTKLNEDNLQEANLGGLESKKPFPFYQRDGGDTSNSMACALCALGCEGMCGEEED